MLLDYSPQILQLSPCHTVYNVKTQVTNTILFQHVMICWIMKNKEQLQHFYFISLFYTKDIQDRYRLNAPTFVNQKKVFSKKENLSMTLISRHSILSLQPTQFPFMFGLKQSVRWTASKYLIS